MLRRTPSTVASFLAAVWLLSPTAALRAQPDIVYEDESLGESARGLAAESARAVSFWGMIQRIGDAAWEQGEAPATPEVWAEHDARWRVGDEKGAIRRRAERGECAEAVETLRNSNPSYLNLWVLDRYGVLVCMADRAPAYWFADESTWTGAWSGGEGAIFVSEAEKDPSTGLDVMRISVPVRRQGEVVGVLVAVTLTGGA